MSARTIALWGVGTLAVAILIGGMCWAMIAADRRDARDTARQFAAVNTICGHPPRSFKTHGPSWSFPSYIEVTCADGTKRAVR
jgi:hypothetical protein